nr:nucleolar protein 58-like [Ipomoea batatas]
MNSSLPNSICRNILLINFGISAGDWQLIGNQCSERRREVGRHQRHINVELVGKSRGTGGSIHYPPGPVSLSDAAVIISDFVATETGASDAVSVYIRRAADAFNQLVQFHHDLRYPNSGTKFLAKERVDYAQKESVKVEQFPEEKLLKKKHKKQGNDKIRDLDVKKEAFVKTEPDSLATEENRKIKKYGAEKVKKEDKVKIEKGEEDGKYQENNYEKVKTEAEVDVVEGDSMKKKEDKKNKKRKLSEGNEGEGGETLVVETKKRKSEDIDGSPEQNSKKKKSKKRVEAK